MTRYSAALRGVDGGWKLLPGKELNHIDVRHVGLARNIISAHLKGSSAKVYEQWLRDGRPVLDGVGHADLAPVDTSFLDVVEEVEVEEKPAPPPRPIRYKDSLKGMPQPFRMYVEIQVNGKVVEIPLGDYPS